MKATQRNQTDFGIGLYSIHEAKALLHVSASKIRRWLDPDHGVVDRHFDPERGVITFLELMELHFVAMFRNEGVSLQTIRKTAATASKRFDTKYPFAVKRFDTDGKTVFATLISDETNREMIEDLNRGQYVLSHIMKPFFRKLEYHADEAFRYWPMGIRRRVVLDPDRKFGRPIDAATGVPTRALYDAYRVEQSKKVVSEWFNVPLAAVTRALDFEESLAS